MTRKLWGIYQVMTCWAFTVLFCTLGGLFLLLTLRVFSYSLASRMLRFYGRGMCWLSRIEIVVEGEEHLETAAPCVIAMNHTSVIDIFVISSYMPARLVVVGKKEMLLVPFVGQIYWLMRFITVDRKNSVRAVASMKRANRLIADNKLRVLVAPEGTRTKDGTLGPFKKGAFFTAMELGCPIVSMVMAGSYALHPSGQVSSTPGRVRIRVLPPMDSSTFNRANLQDKADELRQQMSDALDEMSASDPKISRYPRHHEQTESET